MTTALLLVDLQVDFLPGGALGVPGGDEVIALANRWLAVSPMALATLDYHPARHGSFASEHPGKTPGEVVDLHGIAQVLWPDHCVQDSPGVRFAPGLDAHRLRALVAKGKNPRIDSYSGFFDNDQRTATGLHDVLQSLGVDALRVMGIATDYCVRATVLDALRLGYRVEVLTEGCRAVDLQPGDGARALEEMQAAGATLVTGLDVTL